MWNNENSYIMLVGMKIDKTTVENNLPIQQLFWAQTMSQQPFFLGGGETEAKIWQYLK